MNALLFCIPILRATKNSSMRCDFSISQVTYMTRRQPMKQNFDDQKVRVYWRSKQVLDFGRLFEYSGEACDYYVQLEDDIIAMQGYLVEMVWWLARYFNLNFVLVLNLSGTIIPVTIGAFCRFIHPHPQPTMLHTPHPPFSVSLVNYFGLQKPEHSPNFSAKNLTRNRWIG